VNGLQALGQVARAVPARADALAAIAFQATHALLGELATWPKPGLVSPVDNGSHSDMDAELLQRSAEALRPFFEELARAGREQAPMRRLRSIGLRAEAGKLKATRGVNTHRGAIFGLGLLCAAAGRVAELTEMRCLRVGRPLGLEVAQRWGEEILHGPRSAGSNGSVAMRVHGAGGAPAEAAAGFPSVYEISLPALRLGRTLAPDDPAAARVQACFALIARVRDTNLLHRGGREGARFAAEAAVSFLADGGVGSPTWRERAAAVHDEFVSRRLSPGGCADLLAMTLFVDVLESGAAPGFCPKRALDI
jgi:triphosphoribosyl-dephospho-CoA synthase